MEKVTLPPRLDDDALLHVRADISKLRSIADFEPQYDVFETVRDVLQSFREA